MASVTRACAPRTRSAFVATMFLPISFFTSGRVAASEMMDTTKNSVSCSHTGPSQMAAISPATLPSTNQMDVSPAVAASTTPKSTIAPIQITVAISLLPPFRHRPIRPASAATPARIPAASHLFRGARLLKNAASERCSDSVGSGAGSGSGADDSEGGGSS